VDPVSDGSISFQAAEILNDSKAGVGDPPAEEEEHEDS
jgi:hypothetical protein